MTDLRPEMPDDPLPRRLAGWFDREVSRAAADLRAAPLGSARAFGRAGHLTVAPLVAVAVVMIAVVAGLARLPGLAPGVEPTGSSSPGSSSSGTPTDSSPSPTGTTIPFVSVESRYADGIPSSISGLHVARVTDPAAMPSGSGSFLLGGWSYDFSRIVYACVVQLEPAPSFGPVCGTPFLTQNPIMDEQPRVMLDGWTSAIPAGPVVLQVHRHDPRSATCSGTRRDACENMAVIENLVWAGDSTTATAPLQPTDTFMRLIGGDASLPQARVEAVYPTGCPPGASCFPPFDFPVVPLPSATIDPSTKSGPLLRTCTPPYPQESWSVDGASIELVLVFPTIASREIIGRDFTASGFIGTTFDGRECQVLTDSFFSREWIAVDNVMVAVRVNASGTTAAQSKLVDEVRKALTRP
jgi:hypothetical protein